MYDNAKKVTDWTGGGLHATTDPGTGKAGDCFTDLIRRRRRVQARRPTPKPNDGIYNCNPKNVFTLTGDYGKGVTLPTSARRSPT